MSHQKSRPARRLDTRRLVLPHNQKIGQIVINDVPLTVGCGYELSNAESTQISMDDSTPLSETE